MNKNFVLVFTLLEAKNCLLRFFGAKQCLSRKMLASRGRIASMFVNTLVQMPVCVFNIPCITHAGHMQIYKLHICWFTTGGLASCGFRSCAVLWLPNAGWKVVQVFWLRSLGCLTNDIGGVLALKTTRTGLNPSEAGNAYSGLVRGFRANKSCGGRVN